MGACGGKQDKSTPDDSNNSALPEFHYLYREKGRILFISKNGVKKIDFVSKMDFPKDSAVQFLQEGTFLVAGGTRNSEFLSEVYLASPESKQISIVKSLPVPVIGGHLHEHGSWVYLVAGVIKGESGLESSPLMRYSPSQDTWEVFQETFVNDEELRKQLNDGQQSEVSSAYSKRDFKLKNLLNPGTFLMGDKIYFVGGQRKASRGELKSSQYVYSLDLSDEQFSLKMEPVKMQFKVINPKIAASTNHAILVGGKHPHTGEYNKNVFEFSINETGPKFNKIDGLNFELEEHYPAICTASHSVFVSFPNVAVRKRGVGNWYVFNIEHRPAEHSKSPEKKVKVEGQEKKKKKHKNKENTKKEEIKVEFNQELSVQIKDKQEVGIKDEILLENKDEENIEIKLEIGQIFDDSPTKLPRPYVSRRKISSGSESNYIDSLCDEDKGNSNKVVEMENQVLRSSSSSSSLKETGFGLELGVQVSNKELYQEIEDPRKEGEVEGLVDIQVLQGEEIEEKPVFQSLGSQDGGIKADIELSTDLQKADIDCQDLEAGNSKVAEPPSINMRKHSSSSSGSSSKSNGLSDSGHGFSLHSVVHKDASEDHPSIDVNVDLYKDAHDDSLKASVSVDIHDNSSQDLHSHPGLNPEVHHPEIHSGTDFCFKDNPSEIHPCLDGGKIDSKFTDARLDSAVHAREGDYEIHSNLHEGQLEVLPVHMDQPEVHSDPGTTKALQEAHIEIGLDSEPNLDIHSNVEHPNEPELHLDAHSHLPESKIDVHQQVDEPAIGTFSHGEIHPEPSEPHATHHTEVLENVEDSHTDAVQHPEALSGSPDHHVNIHIHPEVHSHIPEVHSHIPEANLHVTEVDSHAPEAHPHIPEASLHVSEVHSHTPELHPHSSDSNPHIPETHLLTDQNVSESHLLGEIKADIHLNHPEGPEKPDNLISQPRLELLSHDNLPSHSAPEVLLDSHLPVIEDKIDSEESKVPIKEPEISNTLEERKSSSSDSDKEDLMNKKTEIKELDFPSVSLKKKSGSGSSSSSEKGKTDLGVKEESSSSSKKAEIRVENEVV